MNNMTIKEATLKVLKKKQTPLSVKQIYDAILEEKLYEFGAKNPQAILKNTIRQHCDNISLKTSKGEKCFTSKNDGTYYITQN